MQEMPVSEAAARHRVYGVPWPRRHGTQRGPLIVLQLTSVSELCSDCLLQQVW